MRLGLLQLGQRSTRFYQQLLESRKGSVAIDLQLVATDFEKINALLPYSSDRLDTVMAAYLESFDAVDQVIIPNITLHETVDRLAAKVKSQYIAHPLTATLRRLQDDKCSKICLVASMYSMNSSYLKTYFNKQGIDVMIPELQDQQFFDDLRKNVYLGKEKVDEVDHYHRLLNKYNQKAATVIACTELSLALSADHVSIDMARQQIESALEP